MANLFVLLIILVLFQHSSPVLFGKSLKEKARIAEALFEDCKGDAKLFKKMHEKYNADRARQLKEEAARFFLKCIVNLYNFQMKGNPFDPDKMINVIEFKGGHEFPTFAEEQYTGVGPLSANFKEISDAIELFLTSAGPWSALVKSLKTVNGNGFMQCRELLYMVAARYAYYTYKLAEVSDFTLTLCKQNPTKKYFLPETVCYPQNAGSLTCTSDADVGLIGEKAGKVVRGYNEAIGKLRCVESDRDKPTPATKTVPCKSDAMMDNNMYAYSLELATPEIFMYEDSAKNSKHLKMIEILSSMDPLYNMRMLDIVQAALQSMRQGDLHFYNKINKEMLNNLKDGKETEYLKALIDELTKLVKENKSDGDLEKYNAFINSIGECIYSQGVSAEAYEDATMLIKKALLTATGSYHSFGALRTVVVTMQMKVYNDDMKIRLSLNDYIASAIENLGYAYEKISSKKEEGLCTGESTASCIMAASKYIWRTLACLKPGHDILVKQYAKLEKPMPSISKNLHDDTVENEISDVEKARDYVEELYFSYMKVKRDLPLTYKSLMAYTDNKQEIKLSGKSSSKKDSKKEFSANDLLVKYLFCSDGMVCLGNLQKLCFQYFQLMLQLENSPGGSKDIPPKKDSSKRCPTGQRIVDPSVNTAFIEYATETTEKRANCLKNFQKSNNFISCSILKDLIPSTK